MLNFSMVYIVTRTANHNRIKLSKRSDFYQLSGKIESIGPFYISSGLERSVHVFVYFYWIKEMIYYQFFPQQTAFSVVRDATQNTQNLKFCFLQMIVQMVMDKFPLICLSLDFDKKIVVKIANGCMFKLTLNFKIKKNKKYSRVIQCEFH